MNQADCKANCGTLCRQYKCLGIDPPSFTSQVDSSFDPDHREPIYVRYRRLQPGRLGYGEIDWQNNASDITERPYTYRVHSAQLFVDQWLNMIRASPFNWGPSYNGAHRLWPLWTNPNGGSTYVDGIKTPNDPLLPHGTAHCVFGSGGNSGKWNSLYGRSSDWLSSLAGNLLNESFFDGDYTRIGAFGLPLTWAQSMLIGANFNSSSGGVIPIEGKTRGKSCNTDCPEDGEFDAPRPYIGKFREWGPAFFWLQGIADTNSESPEDRKFYLNFFWFNGEIYPYYKRGGDPCESYP